MKFLDNVHISENEFGIEFVIRMNHDWKRAAEKFPLEKIQSALVNELTLGNKFLSPLRQQMELRIVEGYGLTGINLNPERAGIDLQDSQDSYIGHNLTSPLQIAAITPVIFRYLKDLELF